MAVNEDEMKEDPFSEGSSSKKMIMLGLPILMVVFIALGVYFSGIADSFFSFGGNEQKEEVLAQEDPLKALSFYEVPEMLINLSVRPGQKPIYFKIKVVLELSSSEDIPHVEKMLPRIVDSLQFYLREMRLEELQGSMGTYRLKEELMSRMNKVLAPIRVNDVLLKDILIQ